MAELNETPRANRIHIAFFGLKNAGKSTLVNAFTGQDIAKKLGISAPMVNEHLTALFAKIGAANRTEAVTIALRKHLLKI